MDLLTILLALGSLIGAILLKLIGSEVEAWLPAAARAIISRAVLRLPEHVRGRYHEEWSAHNDETPGKLGKVLHASGCWWGAPRVSATLNELQAPPGNQRCSILELTENKCHWPIGEPDKADFEFCGQQTVSTLPYCPYHARIAYAPLNRRRLRQGGTK